MIQPITAKPSLQVASHHGFSLPEITPPGKQERLESLAKILDRQDVSFPIDRQRARAYFELAQKNIPFGIGSLTDLSVDLDEYANAQEFAALGWQEHLSWASLVRSQQAQKHRYACREYLMGEKNFEIRGTTIPDYYILNARIYQQTGWQLATVSEIIPAHVFFHCHSRKFFPVTTFMRPLNTDYLEEPDIGHDIAGHVATFTIPQVAAVMNQHGQANEIIRWEKEEKLKFAKSAAERRAIEDEATELLLYAGRIYWFTVEFGLVMEEGKLKAFGAGILSSPGETRFSIDSPLPNRILIDTSNDVDLLRLATTDYLISEFQKTYFVMKDFQSLETLTADRIVRTVKQAKRLPHHTWREIAGGDFVLNVGQQAMSPNEKYISLGRGEPIDDCVERTAIRNLRMHRAGFELHSQMEQSFVDQLPPIPSVQP